MANFVELPSERDVLALESRAVEARRIATTEHENFRATKRELDDPHSKASRNLLPPERFAATMKAQTEAGARIAAALGDPAANRDALGRYAEALDLRGIVDRAEFLPLMSGGSESMAHDMRVLARSTLRSEYRDRLARMTPEAAVAEARRIARDAGGAPHHTPELARLGELHRHVAGQRGGDWTAARSAVISAFAALESQWHGRAALAQSVESAARAFEAATDLADAVRTGREPAVTTRARAIAQELVAAGKS